MNDATQFFDTSGGDQQYQIERSLRFNSADSAYLSRTPASAGNRRTSTLSVWVKRVRAVTGTNDIIFSTANCFIYFDSNTQGLRIQSISGASYDLTTSAIFRDFSAWSHFVVAFDLDNSTPADRIIVFHNGVQIGNTSPASADFEFNSTVLHTIGSLGATQFASFYLADIHWIDGQALDPSSFGELDVNGVWQPIEYTGTYAGNSFHLPFSDNSTAAALGTDTSGNGNTWTVNNISVAAGAGNDSLTDTPTSYGTDTGAGGEVRGNYCTWNPLNNSISSATLANGNLEVTANTNLYQAVTGTIFASSGKWYAEFLTQTTVNFQMIGIAANTFVPNTTGNRYIGRTADSYGFYWDGNKVYNNTFSAYGTSWILGDILQVALDLDNGKVWFGKNGTWQASGDPVAGTNAAFTGISGLYTFACSPYGTGKFFLNTGQRPFAYTAPSGFKALCDTNLPAPTIADGSTAMDVVLDTGANILTAAQGAIGGSADLLWIKDRANSNNHQLIDTVRGGTATLQSNTTAAETTYSAPSGSSVAWTWDAGSSTVTNTDGSITSQVRANASAGFSIVTYTATGANTTVGHGLGLTPSLVITKRRDSSGSWLVQHKAAGVGYLLLNSTAAYTGSDPTAFNGTAPTSTVFTIGTGIVGNQVAYCFAPVAGYSAFGSYTGNGSSADGPFVYTGMRPRWILIKRTDLAFDWYLFDSERVQYNSVNYPLNPNLNKSETDTTGGYDPPGYRVDFLSNGFKLRNLYNPLNQSNGNYVYAAFAENPFQYARAR